MDVSNNILQLYTIKLHRKMSYKQDELDIYGFYPSLTTLNGSNCNYKYITIEFTLIQYTDKVYGWQQSSGPVIYGFKKRHGQALLNSLNSDAKIDAQVLINGGARTIFPMSYNSTYYILENYNN